MKLLSNYAVANLRGLFTEPTEGTDNWRDRRPHTVQYSHSPRYSQTPLNPYPSVDADSYGL